MDSIYTFFITFTLIFFSELGDKTQLLVLSFATKNKIKNVLLGVAIGTFLSHGCAILFGSKISYFSNDTFQFYLKIFTYFTFLLFGILGFLPKKENMVSHKSILLNNFLHFHLNCIILVAISILVGELGDKTFLASLSLGFQYPNFKISLILGAIFGMVLSNFMVIFLGKLINNKLNPKLIEFISNIIFIIFGLFGFINLIF